MNILYYFFILITIFFIPYICRYLGKIYPFNWGYLYFMLNSNFQTNKLIKKHNKKYHALRKVLFFYSIVFSVMLTTINLLIVSKILLHYYNDNYMLLLVFNIIFLLFTLMAEIDKRYFIIPDIFSYPFILFSILLISTISQNNMNLLNLSVHYIFAESYLDSAIGGLYGYFSGVITSIFFYKKYGDAFGNGDIKILGAIGVLIGINKLYQIIIISFVLFFICSTLLKKKYLPYATVLFPSFLIHALYALYIK